MGDIILKEENGKTVAYERGVFGIEIKINGYERLDSSFKSYDGRVEAGPASRITGDRDAVVNGEEGTFSKEFLDDSPVFWKK